MSASRSALRTGSRVCPPGFGDAAEGVLIQRQVNLAVFGTDDPFVAVIQPGAGDPDRIGRQCAALIEQLGTRYNEVCLCLDLAFAIVQTFMGDDLGFALAGSNQAASVVELSGIEIQTSGNDFAVVVLQRPSIEFQIAAGNFDSALAVVQTVDGERCRLAVGEADQTTEVDDCRDVEGQTGLAVNPCVSPLVDQASGAQRDGSGLDDTVLVVEQTCGTDAQGATGQQAASVAHRAAADGDITIAVTAVVRVHPASITPALVSVPPLVRRTESRAARLCWFTRSCAVCTASCVPA